MIVLVTTRRHRYTLARLKPTEHGFPVPRIRPMSYDRLFRSLFVPRATYLFTDFDRLNAWEQRVAADYFRILSAVGLRCLNDPARVRTRFELLDTLYREGINPQAVYRADAAPRPIRFPVFIRFDDHVKPDAVLLHDQSELDAALSAMRERGVPLRGVLVLEFCGEEQRPGFWTKWGAFRVGGGSSLDHIAVDDNWMVKYGQWDLLSDAFVAEENDAVVANRLPDKVVRSFKIAGIDFGRADFAFVGGEPVIYEINTNPYVGKFVPDPIPLRRQTQLQARRRFAEMLAAIDTPERGLTKIRPSELVRFRRGFVPGLLPHQQP